MGYDYNQITYGYVKEILSANRDRVLKYQIELIHKGLNEHKIISAPDRYVLDNKVNTQVASWNEKWKQALSKRAAEKKKNDGLKKAENRTLEAQRQIEELEKLLIDSIATSGSIEWENLKDKSPFKVTYPKKPSKPTMVTLPDLPNSADSRFAPKFGLFSSIFQSQREKAIDEAREKYDSEYSRVEEIRKKITLDNEALTDKYQKSIFAFESAKKDWELNKKNFEERQDKANAEIDCFKNSYLSNEYDAIVKYCEKVLSDSKLPDFIEKEYELNYIAESKILVIDYSLPAIDNFPKLKSVKYFVTKDEFSESYYSQSDTEKLFDKTVYNLVLRIINEQFEADSINAIDAVSFNGWVRFINKATGKEENACIASIQVRKEEFAEINLESIEPKACFKNLKGIGSSKLAGITPVQPILKIDKNDSRFVDSYGVVDQLDDSTNLAAIPWEDFEHLIRELFETEFSSNGGEVKVTQASRDGGVDAIAFDPDPIRGGKIVIQAKRYTNTVGVSAVRDLYGTVHNEGATKGILVTTADFGPDAYEFSMNKPLTLLNGGNLLALLERHGYKAKIDLKEAKRLNAEKM